MIDDLMDRLQTQIFEINNPESQFEIDCVKRELGIKQYMNICQDIIMQHIEKPSLNSLCKRKELKIEKCISNLVRYLEELYHELDKDKIESYCTNIIGSKSFTSYTTFEPYIMFLIHNSYYGSVVTDILWAPEITVMQAMKISQGKLDLEELGKFLPNLINSQT